MNDDFTIPNHLFTSIRHEFNTIRVMDNVMSPTKINLRLDISTNEDETDDLEDYSFRMEVAIAKIHYFVHNILRNSILIYGNNEWAVETFLDDTGGTTSNNVVLAPEEPTDACISELLMCKFKALSNGTFDLNGLEVESTDSRGILFTFIGSTPGDTFPDMLEWVGERSFFSKPWWDRDDASTLDLVAQEDQDTDTPPDWAYSLGFIADSLAPKDRESNVVRAEFRPKIIQGGKTD